MANGPYGLTPQQVVSLAIVHCTLQGIIFPLLVKFLTSEDRPLWFKIYVIWVNVLCLGQTVTHTIQGFDVLNPTPPRVALGVMGPVLTAAIAAFVQAFFIHRCWRIFKQRLLPVIPFMACSLLSLLSGIMLGADTGHWLRTGSPDKTKFSLALWTGSSFLLDFATTFTTIAYLYRVRSDLKYRKNIFSTVWQIIWASAAPPLILMAIVLVDGFLVMQPTQGYHAAAPLAAATTGKCFVLSLMINIIGQGYIRQQFERPRSPSGGFTGPRNKRGGTSEPTFAPGIGNTTDLIADLGQEVSRVGRDDFSQSQVTVNNPPEPTDGPSPHIVKLALES